MESQYAFPSQRKATRAERKAIEKLATKNEVEYEKDERDYGKCRELEIQLQNLESKLDIFTDEQHAIGGVLISASHNGEQPTPRIRSTTCVIINLQLV